MSIGLRPVSEHEKLSREELDQWREQSMKIAQPQDKLIPLRLITEGLFQLGLVEICSGRHEAGQRELGKALRIAQQNGRTATEAACCLALAESHAQQAQSGMESALMIALSYWHRGGHLLALVRSSFLSEWATRLASEFGWQVAFGLDTPWRQVETKVLKTYLAYQLKRAEFDVAVAQRASGLSKSRFYDLCKELGISLQSGGGVARGRPRLPKKKPASKRKTAKARRGKS